MSCPHLTADLTKNKCLDLRLFIFTKWKKYGYVVVKFVKVYFFLWFEVLRPISYGHIETVYVGHFCPLHMSS